MSTDTRSTVKIVTFLLMLSAAALLLLAIAAGVAFNRHANADTKVITIAPFAIDGVAPAVVHFAESRGPGLFQAAYKMEVGGPDILFECRDGFPCVCWPLPRFQSYNLWTAKPVDLGLDPATTTVAFGENTITLTDSQPIRVHPGDFNGDGETTVQDIYDFLVTEPTPGEVFDFLEAWYSL